MPSNDKAPNFALMADFDATPYSGADLFTHGSTTVAMPTFTQGAGFYDDALIFLNGRASTSGLSLTQQIRDAATFGGSSWDIDFNYDEDKIKIIGSVDFTIAPTSASQDFLGFGGTVDATLVGSKYHAEAPNDWTRGNINNGQYTINEVGGAGTFTFNKVQAGGQDVLAMIRTATDIDNVANTLQKIHAAAISNDNIRWLITDDGYVQLKYLTSIGSFSWDSTSFRDRLGFTGDETASTSLVSPTFDTITATYPLPGALFPSRPLENHHLMIETVSDFGRIIGGGYTSNSRGAYTTSSLRFHLDAAQDQKDLYRHFTDNFIPYVATGEPITLYQEWGDSRRSATSVEQAGAYSSLYTIEDDGYKGRIKGTLTDPSTFDLTYPSRIRRRVPVNLMIEHD
jgi:hypothetical protein